MTSRAEYRDGRRNGRTRRATARSSTDRFRPTAVRRLVWLGVPLLLLELGCGIAPHNFRALNHPAAIVRARSVGFGDGLPNAKVVPALITRLEDTDPVVRLSAHEELRRRTGQDFGFVPWAVADDRARAVARWQQWWRSQKPALVRNRQNP